MSHVMRSPKKTGLDTIIANYSASKDYSPGNSRKRRMHPQQTPIKIHRSEDVQSSDTSGVFVNPTDYRLIVENEDSENDHYEENDPAHVTSSFSTPRRSFNHSHVQPEYAEHEHIQAMGTPRTMYRIVQPVGAPRTAIRTANYQAHLSNLYPIQSGGPAMNARSFTGPSNHAQQGLHNNRIAPPSGSQTDPRGPPVISLKNHTRRPFSGQPHHVPQLSVHNQIAPPSLCPTIPRGAPAISSNLPRPFTSQGNHPPQGSSDKKASQPAIQPVTRRTPPPIPNFHANNLNPVFIGRSSAWANQEELVLHKKKLSDALNHNIRWDYETLREIARDYEPPTSTLAEGMIGIMETMEDQQSRDKVQEEPAMHGYFTSYSRSHFLELAEEFKGDNRIVQVPISDTSEFIDLCQFYAGRQIGRNPLKYVVFRAIEHLLSAVVPEDSMHLYTTSEKPKRGHKTIDPSVWKLSGEIFARCLIVEIPPEAQKTTLSHVTVMEQLCEQHCKDLFSRARKARGGSPLEDSQDGLQPEDQSSSRNSQSPGVSETASEQKKKKKTGETEDDEDE